MKLHYQILMKDGQTLNDRNIERESAQALADELKLCYPDARAIASWEPGAYPDDFDVLPLPNIYERQ